MSIRNELLEQICTAYGADSTSINTMDAYLLYIAIAVGAEIRNPNIRNMLLEDILKSFDETYFLEDYLLTPDDYMEAG